MAVHGGVADFIVLDAADVALIGKEVFPNSVPVFVNSLGTVPGLDFPSGVRIGFFLQNIASIIIGVDNGLIDLPIVLPDELS